MMGILVKVAKDSFYYGALVLRNTSPEEQLSRETTVWGYKCPGEHLLMGTIVGGTIVTPPND